MEIATLLCAYLGLRLFRHNWKLRMAIIVVPLLMNGILYAVYHVMLPCIYTRLFLLEELEVSRIYLFQFGSGVLGHITLRF